MEIGQGAGVDQISGVGNKRSRPKGIFRVNVSVEGGMAS
jgi:hypothetical protein